MSHRNVCKPFRMATEAGTDPEGYGCAIGTNAGAREWYVGGMVENPITYCPFCGKRLIRPNDQDIQDVR